MEPLEMWPWGSTKRESTNGARDTLALRNRLRLSHLQDTHILFVGWLFPVLSFIFFIRPFNLSGTLRFRNQNQWAEHNWRKWRNQVIFFKKSLSSKLQSRIHLRSLLLRYFPRPTQHIPTFGPFHLISQTYLLLVVRFASAPPYSNGSQHWLFRKVYEPLEGLLKY